MSLIKQKNNTKIENFTSVKVKINQKTLSDFENAKSNFLIENQNLDVEILEIFLETEVEKSLKKAIQKLKNETGSKTQIERPESVSVVVEAPVPTIQQS